MQEAENEKRKAANLVSNDIRLYQGVKLTISVKALNFMHYTTESTEKYFITLSVNSKYTHTNL